MISLQVLAVAAALIIQVYSQRFDRVQQNNFVRDSPQVPLASTICQEKNGRYPTRTCDGYIECVDGIPEEKLCPDGLLFNPAAGVFAFPCQYPIDVDCTGREQTQPPQSTEDCPHQFGYYSIGDQRSCGQFKNCVDGRAFIFDCPEGLAFDGESYRCDWPDQVPTCDAEAYLGFTCPPDARQFGLGQEEYRYFRSPNDCQRYFICIENRPRLYNCGEGKAFNDLINACDGIENVTGCALPGQFQTQPQIQFRGTPTKLPTSRFNG
ncbi:protein obstructor-E-like [Anoplophora glabripennis]|uniref:protein obstructor-E-like n=1 Tax=Anoplophora glabripennis TaxID=217634 RepID=UPI00087454CC|nr:protein obstructor-E-like [Anoplophora glabripennis]